MRYKLEDIVYAMLCFRAHGIKCVPCTEGPPKSLQHIHYATVATLTAKCVEIAKIFNIVVTSHIRKFCKMFRYPIARSIATLHTIF